ncbi:MAG TPA: protein-L-isoaspartate(D-aspartate) O-methyltransferase [Candidatus Hypogeohydataceae bacterium YC41]
MERKRGIKVLWDFEKRRKEMVEYQLRLRDITDERVLAAMEKIPRHLFLPVEFWLRAYDDAPVPIGEGQTMSQPYMVAFMTQALRLKKEDKVLEIGTGSGYQTAVLAEIVDKVYTVEVRPYLAARAKEILEELGYALKIIFRISNGHWGYEEAAPYDAILVTAAAPNIPPALIDQLADGGKLVIPVGWPEHQILYRITKQGSTLKKEELLGCIFVPMVSKEEVES